MGRARLPKFGSSSALGRVSQCVMYNTRCVAVGLKRAMMFVSGSLFPSGVVCVQR
jgi:hypothetical protein